MVYNVKCILCGKFFNPIQKNIKICSGEHYNTCKICGCKFEVSKHNYKKQCCTRKCSDILGKYKREETCLKLYGVKNAGGIEESLQKVKNHNLRKYGVPYAFQAEDVKQKIQKTNLNRYGVDNPQKSSVIQQRTANTCMRRYGDTSVLGKNSFKRKEIDSNNLNKYGVSNLGGLPDIVEKIKQTHISRYGKWYTQTDEYKIKMNTTSMAKYGTMWPAQSDVVKDKIRDTNITKYGKHCVLNSDKIKEKISNTNQAKYGVPWHCMTPECIANNKYRPSKITTEFGKRLQDILDIDIEYEYNVGNILYDIHVKGTNILLEINPSATHSNIENYIFKPKNISYHRERSEHARNYNYRCIHIWDWDKIDVVNNLIYNKKIKLYARNLKLIKLTSDLDFIHEFLSSNHIQGTCNGQIFIYGLYLDSQLVQLVSFGKPRYNSNYEYELLRLCTDYRYYIVGGSERLFTTFTKDVNPNSIISYCDISKFTGEVYNRIGFKHIYDTSPSIHWSKGNRQITNNLLNQLGYDKLFDANFGKGTLNYDLMIKGNWLPVYDCGQQVWEWRR